MTPSLCQSEPLGLLVLLSTPLSLSLSDFLSPPPSESLSDSHFLSCACVHECAPFSLSFFLCVSLPLTLPLSSFSLPFLACFFPLALSFSLARSISLSL